MSSLKHNLSVVELLVKKELKVKYRGTLLGYLWSMLNPLLFMIIISIVFSHLVRGIENYSVFVLAGILYWNFVSTAIVLGTNSIVSNAHLVQKVRMAVWIFPLSSVGSSLANMVLALIPYAVVCIWMGVGISPLIILMPLVLILTAVFVLGISLALSSLNVFFRDVAHVMEPILTLAFYATPIIYDRKGSMIPETLSQTLAFNPFVHFVEALRATILPGAGDLSLQKLAILLLLATVSLVAGSFIYLRSRKHIPLSL